MFNNLHKSLLISERYKILSELPECNKLNKVSIIKWRKDMSIISDDDFSEMLKANRYNKSIFSNAVNYHYTKDLVKMYRRTAMEQDWYNFLDDSFKSEKIEYKVQNTLSYVNLPFLNKVKKDIYNFLETENLYIIDKNNKEDIVNKLMEYLEEKLLDLTERATVLELNIHREKGKLQGNTTNERYDNFISQMKNKDALVKFYDKNIVLLRLVSMTSMSFYEYIKEILINIKNDKKEIEKAFNINCLKIQSIYLGKGDTHQKGKTVGVVKLNNKKIVVDCKIKLATCI